MLKLYAEAGLTSVEDRAVGPAEVALYESFTPEAAPGSSRADLADPRSRPIEPIEREIAASKWKTGLGDDWLRFATFKVTLDGGQSVGHRVSAHAVWPFGKQLYGQTDPDAGGRFSSIPTSCTGFSMRLARRAGSSRRTRRAAARSMLCSTHSNVSTKRNRSAANGTT